MKCNTDTLKRLFLTQKHQMMTEFWVKTHAYWIYSNYLAWFDPNKTIFTLVWSLCGLIWPQIILNSSSWQKFESKHMHIGHISITLPDMTLIWRFWPKFDFLMTWFDLKNLKFEVLTKFRDETYVYWIYFDHLAKFTLIWRLRPKFDLLMTWFDLTEFWICILDKIRSPTICILGTFRFICPIRP